MSTVLFTHKYIEVVDQPITLLWVLFSQSATCALLNMAAGLIFFWFAYSLQVAQAQKQLFESGFLVEDEQQNNNRNDINNTIDVSVSMMQ